MGNTFYKINIKHLIYIPVRLRQGYGGHYFAYASCLVWPAIRSVADAKCGWGALNSLGILCLRGIPDGLTTQYLSNLLIVEPATDVADYEPWPRPMLKRPKWGV